MNKNPMDMEKVAEEYYDRIYEYIYRRVSSKDVVRDLTQEVFLALCESKNRDTIHDVAGWLYAVAQKRIALHFRHKQSKSNHETMTELDETLITVSYDPFSEYSDEEYENMHQEVLASLTDSEAALYDAVYKEKLGYETIAEQQNISEETLRKRISRLKRKIKQAIHKVLYCWTLMMHHI